MCMYVSDRLRLFALGLSCRDRAAVRGNVRLSLSLSCSGDKGDITRIKQGALPARGKWLRLSCYLHTYMTVADA